MRLGSRSVLVGIVHKTAFRHHFLQFLAIACLSTQASASILEKTSVKDMTRDAKEVRIGEVVSTWTSPEPDQKMFFTYVKVKVEKTLKGQDSSEILLRQPGGTYRDPESKKVFRQIVSGMDRFQKGEKALFFITHSNDGAPTVMFQGKHQIVKDEKSGLENVVREKNDDVMFSGKKMKNEDHSHEKSLFAVHEKQPLDEMIFEIQKTVETQKGESTRK